MRDIARLFNYARGLYGYVAFVALAGVIGSLLGMAMPFIMKFATDEVTQVASGAKAMNEGYLILLLVALITTELISTLLSNVTGYFGDLLASKMRFKLSQNYYDHLLRLPQNYYDNENTGKIISRLDRAIADVTRFINMFSNLLLNMLLTMIISIGVLFWYSWEIGLVVLVQIPVYIYLTMLTSKKWQKLEEKKNEHLDVARGRFSEVVGQMRLVKSFVTERRESKFFKKNFSKTVEITQSQSRYWHIMDALRSSVRVAVYGVVFGILFWRTARGEMTIGDFVLITALLQQAISPLENMSFFVDMYQRAVANSRDYAKAMDEVAEPDMRGGVEIKSRQADIEYTDVSFGYGKRPIIKNINFTVGAGQKLAMVSKSGGGKTTLANLLMRLYAPSSGQITINGTDIATLKVSNLRGMIATVFQDATLFSGTVRENISYAKPNATDAEIKKAAKAANALDFINDLDDGFDTVVGERGVKLSGGQRQRIAIARAILKDAPILILDEATSALDSHAEQEVQVALDRLMEGRTTLIIAHRLSTIANVDTVITLKNGTIDEIGTPAKLAKTGGIYSQLLDIQLGTTKDAKKRLEKFDIAH